MLQSTLCYLERGEEYLMLHRVKKAHDANRDKWIGIGGKFEDRESPEDCLLRECREETGLIHARSPSSQGWASPVQPVAVNRCIYSVGHSVFTKVTSPR